MNDEDVTHVTRNEKGHPELKLLIDLVTSAALLYYATHPDCLDGVGDNLRKQWGKVVHRLSVWATYASIRSLPETDE